MKLGLERTVLLVCGIMNLIGGVHLRICSSHEKHELLRRGLLDQKSICRALKFEFTDKICLNGLLPTAGSYCVAGPCSDEFGHNCGDPCFSGEDNIYSADHDLACDANVDNERLNLCLFYQEQLRKQTDIIQRKPSPLIVIPFFFFSMATDRVLSWKEYGDIEENVELACKGTPRFI